MKRESTITELLQRAGQGAEDARAELYQRVYGELRARAAHYLPEAGHTLDATALVNESYLKVASQSEWKLEDRSHFFAVSSQAMRQVLVDHARSNQRLKRGGDAQRVPLEVGLFVDEREVDLLELNDALERLALEDERQARVVELRFFGGLSVEETAEVLKLGTATVKRDWKIARLWLLDALRDPD